MASRLRRRSGSQLSPEEESLLQTIISQDGAALRSQLQHCLPAIGAVLEIGDSYPEIFVLYVAYQLECEGKSMTSLSLYGEVERHAALRSEIFMNNLKAQTLSKTFSDLKERTTNSGSDLNSSTMSFRSASLLTASTDMSPTSSAAVDSVTTASRQNGQSNVTQVLSIPQYVLTESNRSRESNSLVTTDGAAGNVNTVKGIQRTTGRNNLQRENFLSHSISEMDVVDGAAQGHFYEDEVDNAAPTPKPGFTTSRPHPKISASLTSNMTQIPKESEGFRDGRTKAAHIRECLAAVNGENKILESYRLCTVCKKSPRNITFLPCGHFTSCRECAGPIYVCGLCGKNVLATVDTFLS